MSNSELETALKTVASDQESIEVCLTDDYIEENEKGDTTGLTTAAEAIQSLARTILPNLDYKKGRGIRWANGETIRVRFINPVLVTAAPLTFGAPFFFLYSVVLDVAKEWEEHANIKFQLVFDEPSHIRVSLEVGKGFNSCVGITATHQDLRGEPTMNLDILGTGLSLPQKRRGILHEFGHALGLMHEHQRSDFPIPYNEAKVFDFYKKYTNWDEEKIRRNVLSPKTPEHGTQTFDKDSIMLYPVLVELTKDGTSYPRPLVLSARDKEFIGRMYPKKIGFN